MLPGAVKVQAAITESLHILTRQEPLTAQCERSFAKSMVWSRNYSLDQVLWIEAHQRSQSSDKLKNDC